MKAETIDGLYAQLRRCRDHCRGEKYVQHRTDGDHLCDEHSARRPCAQVTFQDPSAYCRWCERMCRQRAFRMAQLRRILTDLREITDPWSLA